MVEDAQLQTNLGARFALQVVKLVSYTEDYSMLKRALGKTAAALFDEEIQKKVSPVVGIGGGSTLYEMIESLDYKSRDMRIYPISMIGRGPEIEYVDSTYLATSLFYKSRPAVKAFVTGIPPLPSDKEKALAFTQFLLEEIPEVRMVYEGARNVDMAFVGLGAMIPMGDFTDELSKLGVTLRDLKAQGAVGGINYNWFDGYGNQIGQYFLTVSIGDLKRLSSDPDRLIVLVAGGKHKIDPIRIALSSRMVNAIITDELTALRLTEAAESKDQSSH